MSGASRDGRDWYNRQSRQWRNLGIAISIAFFIAIFVVGPAALLPTQENDALTVLRLAQDARYVDGAGGYYITALISASLSKDMQQAIVFILGIIFIYRVHRDLRNPYTVGLAVFLLIAPTVLFLTLFMKDSSIPALTLLTLITLQSQRHDIVKVLVVAVIYGAYGLIFRQYYLLVVGIFFVLVFGSRI